MKRREFLKIVAAAGAAVGAALILPWKRSRAKWHHVVMVFDRTEGPGVHVAIDGRWIGTVESWKDAWDAVSTGVKYSEDKRQIAEAREWTAENGEGSVQLWQKMEGLGV